MALAAYQTLHIKCSLWPSLIPITGAIFNVENTVTKSSKDHRNVTLRFGITSLCERRIFSKDVRMVTVKRESDSFRQTPMCEVLHFGSECSAVGGCTCNATTLEYSMTRAVTAGVSDNWLLTGEMQDGQTFHEVVPIDFTAAAGKQITWEEDLELGRITKIWELIAL